MAMNRGFLSFWADLAIRRPHLCRLNLVRAFGPLGVDARLPLDGLVLPPIRTARGRNGDWAGSGLAVSDGTKRRIADVPFSLLALVTR
jgi:hypothetical protein